MLRGNTLRISCGTSPFAFPCILFAHVLFEFILHQISSKIKFIFPNMLQQILNYFRLKLPFNYVQQIIQIMTQYCTSLTTQSNLVLLWWKMHRGNNYITYFLRNFPFCWLLFAHVLFEFILHQISSKIKFMFPNMLLLKQNRLFPTQIIFQLCSTNYPNDDAILHEPNYLI